MPKPPPAPEVAALQIAEDPDAWAGAGFAVDADGACRLGPVRVELVGPDAGFGVVGWSLRHVPVGSPTSIDGFVTRCSVAPPCPPATHPSTITAIDHVVLLTDDLERTVVAAGGVGLTPRRWREHTVGDGTPVRQVFFVAGSLVLELVGPTTRPATPRSGVRSFGLAVVVDDFEAARESMSGHLGEVRDAVQPGRRIATVRHSALGLRTPIALMSPRPRPAAPGPF